MGESLEFWTMYNILYFFNAHIRNLTQQAKLWVQKLARACDVPVGRRSGGQLAMTLVAIINVIIFFSFFSFLFFSFFFSSPSSTFLIEGVLESKNLFSESGLKCPKT